MFFYYSITNIETFFYFCKKKAMEFISQTWHWSVSGFLIGLVLLLLTYFGKNFGMSSNLRSFCAMSGVGRYVPFFDWDWKAQRWNFLVVLGAMVGGFVAVHFLSNDNNVSINPTTIAQLSTFGIQAPNGKLAPELLFGNSVFHVYVSIFSHVRHYWRSNSNGFNWNSNY